MGRESYWSPSVPGSRLLELHNSSYDYLLNGVDTVAFLVLNLTLFGLYKIFRSAMGKTRALFGLVAAAAFRVAGLANLLEHCAGLEALGFAYVMRAAVWRS